MFTPIGVSTHSNVGRRNRQRGRVARVPRLMRGCENRLAEVIGAAGDTEHYLWFPLLQRAPMGGRSRRRSLGEIGGEPRDNGNEVARGRAHTSGDGAPGQRHEGERLGGDSRLEERAGILGAFLQPDVMRDFVGSDDNPVIGSIKGICQAMANGFSIDFGLGEIDRLLSRGGMDSMLLTLWLIIGAVTFGTLIDEFGLIHRLINPLISTAESTGRLFVTVFACAFGSNVVAGDQYIALVLPSRVFRAEFAQRGLAPTNLSRLAADSGTVTSPLVPWNSCGAFMGAVLGVPTLLYLPSRTDHSRFRAQAEPRRGCLCLCEGRVRRVPGFLLGLRLLGQRLCRQRDLLAADHVNGRSRRARTRRRRHRARCRTVDRRDLGVLLPHPAWCSGSGNHQPDRHHRQGCSDLGLHPPHPVRSRPAGFADNLRGGDYGSLFEQVRGTMLVTVFVFLGVEGASVSSRHAKRREDVGRATVLGFLSVFAVFASVTIVSYGILPYSEIAQLRQPSMAGVLEAAVGPWGQVFVSVGLVVSVLGAYLAWTLVAAEVLFVAAADDDMPRFLRRKNAADVPTAALLMTTILIQVMLVVTVFSADAFNFALDLTSALTLIPFLLAAGFALKLVLSRETYAEQPEGWNRDLAVATLATTYTAFLLFAAGPKFILVSFIIYAPASILFVMSRREQGRGLFSPRELVILVISVLGAVLGIIAIAAGWITI